MLSFFILNMSSIHFFNSNFIFFIWIVTFILFHLKDSLIKKYVFTSISCFKFLIIFFVETISILCWKLTWKLLYFFISIKWIIFVRSQFYIIFVVHFYVFYLINSKKLIVSLTKKFFLPFVFFQFFFLAIWWFSFWFSVEKSKKDENIFNFLVTIITEIEQNRFFLK